MAQRPLKRNTCKSCNRTFYSRSPLSKFCSSACQSREWRKHNTASQAELEAQFNAQESAKQQEAA